LLFWREMKVVEIVGHVEMLGVEVFSRITNARS
jgi:hypothetical protein